MSFDIPLHIENNTPEAQVIEAIIRHDHVSPEEAVRRALRGMAIEDQSRSAPSGEPSKKPGELLFGLYADEPELMQRIAEGSRRARDNEIVKDYSA
jgi:hypothetical protein